MGNIRGWAHASQQDYRQKSYREFGGITGDLAGYFVTLCEGVMAVLVAAAGLIG